MVNFDIEDGIFVWNSKKEIKNIHLHKVSFSKACEVFLDSKRLIALDERHSKDEERLFCIGRTVDGLIATVRFTYRGQKIRIIGAGYWRKGKKLYEEKNQSTA